MTSEDRKEARYQRRLAKRKEKVNNIKYQDFDELFTFDNLYKAGKKVCNKARYKSSVISFETDLCHRISKIYKDIYNNTRKFKGFISWIQRDRGKERVINTLHIDDKALQKCLCYNLLLPLLKRSFIYENAACIKHKGMSFSLSLIKKHLSKHFRKYGLNGGIYLFDFKDYFLSLPHDDIKEKLKSKIKDERIYNMLSSFIDDFNTMQGSLGKNKGVCLGTEISYILALDYTNPLDHYIKDHLKVKGYGRYMDDGYIISDSIEKLKEYRALIHIFVRTLGIRLNEKKDKIIPFKCHGFTFLKMRIHVDNNGKIIMRLSRKSIKAMRRKLTKFKKWLDNKSRSIDIKDIISSYKAWRSYALHCDSYRTIKNMDNYFQRLFKDYM